jgi:hypothetical protein
MADRSTSALISEIRYLVRMITKISEVREPLRSALAPTIRPLADELDRLSGDRRLDNLGSGDLVKRIGVT